MIKNQFITYNFCMELFLASSDLEKKSSSDAVA